MNHFGCFFTKCFLAQLRYSNEMKCLDVEIVRDSELLGFFFFFLPSTAEVWNCLTGIIFLLREAVNAPSSGFLSPNFLTGIPKTRLAIILPSPLVSAFDS